jgi:hypothetical protein
MLYPCSVVFNIATREAFVAGDRYTLYVTSQEAMLYPCTAVFNIVTREAFVAGDR